MSYRLSLLDKSPIAEHETAQDALLRTLQLAQQAENWGYHRFWIAEHHNTSQLASPSPELLIAWILGQTRRIRVGSGGVMLQHYSPYKVAENFHLLASLATGRVDLGVGKAPGGLPLSTKALQGELAGQKDFPALLAQLTRYLDAVTEPASGEAARALPAPSHSPSRFLLGASAESARLAAHLGWNFVYAGFINASEQAMREAVLTFHEYAQQGKALISLAALAADTTEEAASLLAEQHNYRVTLGERHVTVGSEAQALAFVQQAGAADYRIEKQALNVLHGTADVIHQRLAALQQSLKVDEFILHTPLSNPARRLRSITLLAGQH